MIPNHKLDAFADKLDKKQQLLFHNEHNITQGKLWGQTYKLMNRPIRGLPIEYVLASVCLALLNAMMGATKTLAKENPAAAEIVRQKIKQEVLKW